MMLHLVNYNVEEAPAIEFVAIRCRLPEGATAKAVKTYSPDMDSSQTLDPVLGQSEVSFTLPAVKTYTIVVIDY